MMLGCYNMIHLAALTACISHTNIQEPVGDTHGHSHGWGRKAIGDAKRSPLASPPQQHCRPHKLAWQLNSLAPPAWLSAVLSVTLLALAAAAAAAAATANAIPSPQSLAPSNSGAALVVLGPPESSLRGLREVELNKRTASSSSSSSSDSSDLSLPEAGGAAAATTNLEEFSQNKTIYNSSSSSSGASGGSKTYLASIDNLAPEGVKRDELIELLAELYAYKQVLRKHFEQANEQVYMKLGTKKQHRHQQLSNKVNKQSDLEADAAAAAEAGQAKILLQAKTKLTPPPEIHLNNSYLFDGDGHGAGKEVNQDNKDEEGSLILLNAEDNKGASFNHQDQDYDQDGNNSLIDLLERHRVLRILMADHEGLVSWLRQRQREFPSLKNTTFELLKEYPTRSINICLDGPKILILPDGKDILYCYTRDQWLGKLWSDLRLSAYHYPIIVLNILIFLFGTTGNIFVCLSVYRNLQLRNVTNYFIVNLAFADFLVILICLPATGVWDLTLTWFFGTIPCKLIMFLQDVSISVSVLTLTAISLDRYYAICHPLKFKSSLNQAKRIIVLIWIVSLIIMAPDLIYLSAKESQELSEAGLDTVLYSDCNYNLSPRSSSIFQFVKTILLYLVPLILMFCAHYVIMQTLRVASTSCQNELQSMEQVAIPTRRRSSVTSRWASIRPQSHHHHHQQQQQKLYGGGSIIQLLDRQSHSYELDKSGCPSSTVCSIFDNEQKQSADNIGQQQIGAGNKNKKISTTTIMMIENNTSCPQSSIETGTGSATSNIDQEPPKAATLGGQRLLLLTMHHSNRLESRRKAAQMLAAIVVIFGICYLPVHLINFLRLFIEDIPQTDVTSTISMLSHCACYLNSAINPIIYNHMNATFRAEFRKFLSCCLCWPRRWRHGKLDKINTTINSTQQAPSTNNRNKCNFSLSSSQHNNNNNTCQTKNNNNNDDNKSVLASRDGADPETEKDEVPLSAQSSFESAVVVSSGQAMESEIGDSGGGDQATQVIDFDV